MTDSNPSFRRFLHKFLLVSFWLLLFLNLPNLCFGQDKHHHHHHNHEEHESPSFKYSKQANEPYRESVRDEFGKQSDESWSVWTKALASTLLISAAPFFILFFVPLDKSKEKEPLLKMLLSFASGGLLGDSFLHLIPHALTPHSHDGHEEAESHAEHDHDHDHDHDHGHGHGHVGFFVLLGILIFLIVEKSVRLVNIGHSHSHKVESKSTKKENQDKGDHKKDNSVKESKKGGSKKQQEKGAISVSGYLNLAADFTHNLTDGLAIGASYLAGQNIGIITTITILLHEVPHEIGDFAILIQSGCSRRKAMALQLVTALGALMGTVISLMTEGADSVASSWILPFTAGGFIYISTVSIIPELLEDSNFVQSLKEIFAMLVGVLLMVVIADFE